MLSGWHDGEAVERQEAAGVREIMLHGQTGALPIGDVVEVIEISARGVEVVRENDAVQIVQGALVVDYRAGSGVV